MEGPEEEEDGQVDMEGPEEEEDEQPEVQMRWEGDLSEAERSEVWVGRRSNSSNWVVHAIVEVLVDPGGGDPDADSLRAYNYAKTPLHSPHSLARETRSSCRATSEDGYSG